MKNKFKSIRKKIQEVKKSLSNRKVIIHAFAQQIIEINKEIEERIHVLENEYEKNPKDPVILDKIERWDEISNLILKFSKSKVVRVRYVYKIVKKVRKLRELYPEE